MILRTYTLVGTKYLGVWLRLHPAHWACFVVGGPRWGWTVQVGPLNVRIGESWWILSGSAEEATDHDKRRD